MARKIADWTVMVYLAGDNNLSAESVYALTEMKRANLDDHINVIVQFDPKDDYLPTRRFEITKKPDPGKPLSLAPGNLLRNDLGGSPFDEESENAHRREKARADALKQCQTAISDAASKSLRSQPIIASKDTSSIKVSQKDIDKALKESIEFELSNNNAVSDDGETDTGSPTTLYNFMSYCVANFEAKHYMVVLSGHGSGTVRDYLMKDESPDGSLTINELRQAFKDLQPELGETGRKIDILGLDSCLMSMAEVCYELKDVVQILIGCESYSPASGWPYQEILKRLALETTQGEEAIQERVARGVVEEYVNFYADYWLGGVSVDQSALDITKVVGLKKKIDALAKALTTKLKKKDQQAQKEAVDALITAHWEAQSYNGEQFVDLADFCRCLSARYDDKTIIGLCKNLAKYITHSLTDGAEMPLVDKPLTPNDNTYGNNAFVLRSCFNGPVYQFSYGVSIYFPWAKITPDYKELSFVKDSPDTGWAKFLETYTKMTRRAPRNINPADDPAGKLASANSSRPPQRFRMVEDMGPGNPVYSMRNPPIIVMPDDCIRGRDEIVKDMKKMFAKQKTSKQALGRKRKLK